MDAKTTEAVKENYLSWSGGYPPDSERQIFIYLEYALPIDITDADEVRTMLRKWMVDDEISSLSCPLRIA